MKKILIVAFLLAGVTTIDCQQLYLEGGKTISVFRYENSAGNRLENLLPANNSFLALGYRMNVFTENLFLNLNGFYNTYGSEGSDRALDNYFSWEASYLAANAGFDYEFYEPGRFALFVKTSVSAEFMIEGVQTLNSQVYRLADQQDFRVPLYTLKAGLGAQYRITGKTTVFAQYMYGWSGAFKNYQGNLKINSHQVGIGLLINISKNAPDEVETEQVVRLKKELEANNQKVRQIEEESARKVEVLQEEIETKTEVIAAKEEEIRTLKDVIADALMPYQGKGLSVEERDGKVYVTMETDMLFKPGRWEVGTEGEKAVTALGDVLVSNPDVKVLIEGHTDNVPFAGRGNISNNWDLSTKRATAIIDILRKNPGISPGNLTAAGRGEYDPVADNATPEGRAKNRRIEVILTPKLDEMMNLIRK